MYKIKELAELCKTSAKTLRFYDSLGLLKPDYVDKFTDYRYYSAYKIDEYNKIAALKDMGFTLSEISAMKTENTADFFSIKLKELEEAETELSNRVQKLRETAAFFEKEENRLKLNIIETVSETSCHLAYIRVLAESRENLDGYFAQLTEGLDKMKVKYEKQKIVINFDFELSGKMDLGIAMKLKEATEIPDSQNQIKVIETIVSDEIRFITKNTEIEAAYESLHRYLEYRESYCQCGVSTEIYFREKGGKSAETVEIRIPIYKSGGDNILEKRSRESIEAELKNHPAKTNRGDVEIGRWQIASCVPCKEMFNTKKPKFLFDEFTFSELYLMPDFGEYWSVSWRRGYIRIHGAGGDPIYWQYSIEEIDGKNYMFVEVTDYYRENLKLTYVYEKMDSKEYTLDDIRVYDRVDYEFECDPSVVGKWTVYCFNRDKDNFSPYAVSEFERNIEGLYWKHITFNPDGTTVEIFGSRSETATVNRHWTKGLILDKEWKIAPQYELVQVNGIYYLFVEWKSGDYLFGRMKPCHYVFLKQ